MSNITDKLRKDLADAELKEKEAIMHQALEREKHWIGKCYSSHLFQRVPTAGKEITLRRIVDVEWVTDKVHYVGEHITFMYYPKHKRFKVEIQDRWRTDTPFPSWISSFSHEISNELFEQVYNEVQIHADTYFDKIRAMFKQTEYITQGDHTREQSKLKWLSNQKFITLPSTGYSSVKDVLSWQNHPFLYGADQLLDTKESIEIVKEIADDMEKHAIQWGGSIWKRDARRIKVLNEFYKKHKHE
jgi:hypothetical protein